MRLLALPVALIVAAVLYVAIAKFGALGSYEGAGDPIAARIPRAHIEVREDFRSEATRRVTGTNDKQILFGDLHVHSTFSSDAFYMSLPMFQGDGAHPVADACDFARFCSSLDFWSINDHAESLTPRRWDDTKRAIRHCNATAGDPTNPDVVAFLGWEWSQKADAATAHYGHKNVVLLGLEDHEIPARPIGASGRADAPRRRRSIPVTTPLRDFWNQRRYWNYYRALRENSEVPRCEAGVPSPALPTDCYESVPRPAGLFRKLREWQRPAIVIPHGTTWGLYTPGRTTWDNQLLAGMHDPERQILIEVYSGHGNAEEYRDWNEVASDAEGAPACRGPRPDYTPGCWRAGEIIESRCLDAGTQAPECRQRASQARDDYRAAGRAGPLAIPGADAADWLDSGQCRDCFLPAFNYRPGGSVQYALAISKPQSDDDGKPRRLRFGFVGSSDSHSARPGTGYKEFARKQMTDASGPRDEAWHRYRFGVPGAKEPVSRRLPRAKLRSPEFERSGSFFLTGGLAAVHAAGRSRAEIWDALARKEVYATSGERILLWFDLVNAGADGAGVIPMGGETEFRGTPRFRVRAIGSPEQKPGCPDWSEKGLGEDRLKRLCRGECWNPSDVRRKITRIEVVRIRPRSSPDEPVSTRIEDPWLVLPCSGDPAGCAVEFADPDFAAAEGDAVYYVRAIQEPTDAVNGGGLRCRYDAQGQCVAIQPCLADYRTDPDDDCLAPVEERAWSSPIFVDRAVD